MTISLDHHNIVVTSFTNYSMRTVKTWTEITKEYRLLPQQDSMGSGSHHITLFGKRDACYDSVVMATNGLSQGHKPFIVKVS